jgi:hypothetical protein
VLFGEPGTGVGYAPEFCEDEVQRVPGDEHRGGVHDVLARRTLVDVAGGLFGDHGNRCG